MANKNAFGLIQRIYLSAALLVLGSFLFIGLITYYHTRSENERSNRRFLLEKTHALSTALAFYLAEKEGDIYALYTESFYIRLRQIAQVHGLHFEVFDLHGRWISSSSAKEFSYLIVPDSISAHELLQLDEADGNFVYRQADMLANELIAIRVLRNEKGSPIAIVKIPYRWSNEESQAEFARFLQSLALSYILLLPLTLLFAYFLSKYITRSLKSIRTQLEKMTLESPYSPLYWKYDDEIGALVEAYNLKLVELRKSVTLLSEKERESAWRDMARQVAHELKNPLTPMQLGIQHLERSYAAGDVDFPKRLERFSLMMHEQITTLTQLAESFSSFGRLPDAQPRKLDLCREIQSTLQLFEKEERVDFTFQSDVHEAHAVIDSDYLRRILNNLFRNAIQAIEGRGHIETRLKSNAEDWEIEIEDSGVGIPPERLPRIFSPNFTTKSSGMGIGLSMVRNMVDQSDGTITVRSQVGKGTTFCIRLPKAI